jgi:hypothetical protein
VTTEPKQEIKKTKKNAYKRVNKKRVIEEAEKGRKKWKKEEKEK